MKYKALSSGVALLLCALLYKSVWADGSGDPAAAKEVNGEYYDNNGNPTYKTEPDGTVRTLVGMYQGKPLNSPNDLVVKSDGTVWFTDPSYGCLQFLKSATCQTASIDLIQRMET